jgi:hypothetical protein
VAYCGAQRMIYGIVHDMAKKPSARTFLEIGIVEWAICRIAIAARDDGIHDVRSG